jgi:hypothetical protein
MPITMLITLIVTKVKAILIKKKSKAIPLQAWTGPESTRTLKLPDFKTAGT